MEIRWIAHPNVSYRLLMGDSLHAIEGGRHIEKAKAGPVDLTIAASAERPSQQTIESVRIGLTTVKTVALQRVPTPWLEHQLGRDRLKLRWTWPKNTEMERVSVLDLRILDQEEVIWEASLDRPQSMAVSPVLSPAPT